MTTRSTIWIKNQDDSRDGIYCHHDGYPDYVGTILMHNYNDEEIVRELISLGGISSLAETVEETRRQSYHIWRGEDLQIFHALANLDMRQYFQEYNYIWQDGSWWMARENTNFVPLDQIIMEEKNEKFYPVLNEIYNPDLSFINTDDSCPPYLKKQFKSFARMIHMELSDEKFSDSEIEDYLVDLVRQVIDAR